MAQLPSAQAPDLSYVAPLFPLLPLFPQCPSLGLPELQPDHPLPFIFSDPLTYTAPAGRWTQLPAGPLSTAPECSPTTSPALGMGPRA